jgi:hypothetical protein
MKDFMSGGTRLPDFYGATVANEDLPVKLKHLFYVNDELLLTGKDKVSKTFCCYVDKKEKLYPELKKFLIEREFIKKKGKK